MCNNLAVCQEECQGAVGSLGCGSFDPNGGQSCPIIPVAETEVDPFFVTYDHAAQTQVSGCQSTSMSSSQYPMFKGGGMFEPSCSLNPAMRSLAQNYGSPSMGNSERQLGFRCVKTDTRPGLPPASGTARLSLYPTPTCGLIEIASVTLDTPPVGWGTQIRVALGSNLGWATGKFDAALKQYTIDLADKQLFPGTPCPVATYQTLFNGTAVLVLAGVPITSFDVRIRYPGQSGSSNCQIDYTQTVNVITNQGACALTNPPSGAYCP